ncbi:histone-lysine N-methyltransferase SETD1B-like [Kryptolebias marmoratus]|uniref:histone-lysine N-methyltransferase SETD1B-like n=1 Tax=Kryptolebias marmoratus TaxID=37003 RepID=UPI0018ACF7E5|nr:histone-lysine N-methyltransferase SETD1B-like [Kryptolebias marmoratus]XP_037831192.1 histone-lysine N-methyltransferase SETD1B-like [Kryptolebias marmoratus]
MAESGKQANCHFSDYRQRQQATSDSRVCIKWINKMVTKEVQKQIAALRAEFHLMNLELRQQMEAELRKHLGEPEGKEARAPRQHFTSHDLEYTATRQLMKVEDDNSDREEDEEELVDQISRSDSPETSDRDDNGFDDDDDDEEEVCDDEIRPLPADVHSTSHQTERWPINKQTFPSQAPSVSDTNQLMKQSEEKKGTKNPLHMFVAGEQKCKEERVGVDEMKITEALLMENEWKKWLDEQEGRVNYNKGKPRGKKKTEKQENSEKYAGAAKTGNTDTMKKFRTSVGHFFYPCSAYKWEKFDNVG